MKIGTGFIFVVCNNNLGKSNALKKFILVNAVSSFFESIRKVHLILHCPLIKTCKGIKDIK